MDTIYTPVAQQLQQKAKSLVWIDLDQGQIDNPHHRPAIDFPAVLISIDLPRCEDMGHSGEQVCDANIIIRAVSQTWSETNMQAPAEIRALGLQHYDLLKQIHQALHCFNPGSSLGTLRRVSIRHEKRADGLQVHQMVYTAEFYDDTSSLTHLTPLPGIPPDLQCQL